MINSYCSIFIPKVILVLVILCIPKKTNAQDGYIGISIGSSIIPGKLGQELKLNNGLDIHLLNGGYTIKKGIGIALSWTGGAHTSPTTANFKNDLSYGTLMLGPMYSLKFNDKLVLDIKIKGGRSYVKQKYNIIYTTSPIDPLLIANGSTETLSLGYSFGIGIRFNFSNHWCAMVHADYIRGKFFSFMTSSNRFRVLNSNAGIAFRF